MRTVFLNYLTIGICMTPVIAIALFVLPRLSGRFRARLPYLVFLILSVRLLLPWSVTLPGGVSWEVTLEETSVTLPTVTFFSKEADSGSEAEEPDILADTTGQAAISGTDGNLSGTADGAGISSGNAAAVVDESDIFRSGVSIILPLLTVTWILGMVFFLLRYVGNCIRLSRGLRRWKKQPGEATLQCYRAATDAERKVPELWICPILATPMVAGLFSPAIYLPHENYSSRELEMIFTHELTHLGRRDIWYKLVLFAARTVHWMNPFVWLLVKSAMANLEVSCDGDVVSGKDPHYRKAYAEMLLQEATSDLRVQNALTTCFSDEKSALENRLEEVSNMKKRRNGTSLAAVALAIAVLAGSGISFENVEGMEETDNYEDSSVKTDIADADGTIYSCDQLPILDGRLSWGMTGEEAVEIFGEPTSAEESEYGVMYTWEYEDALESGLGDCSQLILYIGENNLTDESGAVFSQGLMKVSLTVDGTTKETILESLEAVYGTFSEESGSTALEMQLKESLPDYFDEAYFCDGWKVETLSEEDYDLLAEVQEATSGWMGLKQPVADGSVLADIELSGTVFEEPYSCMVTITANYLTMLRGSLNAGTETGADEGAF